MKTERRSRRDTAGWQACWPLLVLVVLAAGTLGPRVQAEVPGATSPPRVEVHDEVLLGGRGERFPEILSFKGIPFAAPPVGALRWREPKPYRSHSRVRAAQSFAAACVQDGSNTEWNRDIGAAFGAAPSLFSDPPMSEDCLYLNVWTPALGTARRLPVLVWIHGGANVSGWSFEPNYIGEALAARGKLVVVSIAYRLGVFGFFSHPDLRGARVRANFGLLDQIAALRWVHDNIGSFSGDPDNVTIAGESAGGADVGYLMVSPPAKGLFRRAIAESGGYRMQDASGLADAEKIGTSISAALPGRPNLAGLRRLPSADILRAASTLAGTVDWGPVVDGTSLTMPLAAYYQLVGNDRDAHGCIPSAGYSWCEAQQKCLRPWEEACNTTMTNTNTSNTTVPAVPPVPLAAESSPFPWGTVITIVIVIVACGFYVYLMTDKGEQEDDEKPKKKRKEKKDDDE